jgi:curved DNA-binding protein CbpA
VLGLVPGADRRAIAEAFRRRAAEVHPDRGRGPVERAERHEQFLRLSEAYRSLVA